MSEHLEFIQSLKLGDQVAVIEGCITEDDSLSKVISVTAKYIQVERYPSLKFDRQTGKQVSKKRTYRYLFCPKTLQIQKDHFSYKERLVDLLDERIITSYKFKRCYSALEEILKD
jgi:hypothetical protein